VLSDPYQEISSWKVLRWSGIILLIAVIIVVYHLSTALKAFLRLLFLFLATSCCADDNPLCSALLQSDIGTQNICIKLRALN
jgi:hypothetical protein